MLAQWFRVHGRRLFVRTFSRATQRPGNDLGQLNVCLNAAATKAGRLRTHPHLLCSPLAGSVLLNNVQQGLPARPASPVVDDWEIDIAQLQIDAKIASGAFSNLYRGSYCGQEVAVKILKDVQDDTSQFQEFLQVSQGRPSGKATNT